MKQIRLSLKDIEALKTALQVAIEAYGFTDKPEEIRRWHLILNRLERLKVK